MIHLEKVSERTFRKVIDLKVSEEQSRYVATNLMSMAQAWLYSDDARPFAVCDGDEVVGFLMLSWSVKIRVASIWRFMIGTKYQHKGYGRKALEAAMKIIKDSNLFDIIVLDYAPDNVIARKLYYSLGFRENGEVEDGEIVMTLPLTEDPKVVTLIVDSDWVEDFTEAVEEEKEKGASVPQEFFDKTRVEQAIQDKNLIMYLVNGDAIGFEMGEIRYGHH